MVKELFFEVDGGCRNNGSPNAIGAAACCLVPETITESFPILCRKYHLPRHPAPTNQRAELQAVIMALEWATKLCTDCNAMRANNAYIEVTIQTDSTYASNCMSEWVWRWSDNNWRNARDQPVPNRDLLERARDLTEDFRWGPVWFFWAPRAENELADEKCTEALDEQSCGSPVTW